MDPKFAALVETLAPKVTELLASPAYRKGQLPRQVPASGIYLFSENGFHLYVGRSDNIRRRYGLHTRPSAAHNQASFAFLMARHQTNNLRVAYRTGGGRNWLIEQPEFLSAFRDAKQRIAQMDFRFVEETDANRQALLEIYAAIVLETKYNDFRNH